MGEVRFMISEAAKKVQVESHVLRYWEEELHIPIGRTEMGHRYYTQDDIQLFCCIKKLKNEGVLLRDLKPLIPELKSTRQIMRHTENKEKNALTKTPAPDLTSECQPLPLLRSKLSQRHSWNMYVHSSERYLRKSFLKITKH